MKQKSARMGIVVVILLAAWLLKSNQPASPQAESTAVTPSVTVTLPPDDAATGDREQARARRDGHIAAGPHEFAPYQVAGVRIVDIHTGKSMSIQSVDLRPTLRRIAEGERNSHRNDGSVFRNSARKLPKKPTGYYHEYVGPTEGLRGPGPQRLVIGREGEVYYTHDHYETFIELKGER